MTFKVIERGPGLAGYTAIITDGCKEIASKNFGTRSAAEAFNAAFLSGDLVKVCFKDCKGVFADYFNSLAEFKAHVNKYYNALYADGGLKIVDVIKVTDLLN